MSGTAYATEIQNRHARSLAIAQDVEDNQKVGYGVLTVTDAPLPACIVTPSHTNHAAGLKELLSRERVAISMKLLPQWQFVEMKVEDAFIGAMKQQCGYVAGEASALRSLMDALRRERKLYEFAPVWFETEQVANVAAEVIRWENQKEVDTRDQKKTKDARNTDLQGQKIDMERKLRRENGPKAQALRDRIRNLVKDAAEKPGQPSVEVERLFPAYSA